MKLKQLLKAWMKDNDADCEILTLHNDSRFIEPGALFCAYPGKVIDGRLFIDEALNSGAVAIAYDSTELPLNFTPPKHIPCVAIPNLAQHLATIACSFYDNPSQSLHITGITGTNGKTTIAHQLAQAHQLLGQKAAYIGTIGQGEIGQLKSLNNTTPDALTLFKLLHEYKNQGFSKTCIEVSSHALSQHRVDKINFNQALFTNLSLDHLDYHHSMEEYAKAKAKLFARSELQWVILNQDDTYASFMSSVIKPHVNKVTYGLKNADIKAVNLNIHAYGTELEVHSPWGKFQLKTKSLGKFNIYNSLAVFSSLMSCGYLPQDVVSIMSLLDSAPGRLEIVVNSPTVVVDYAHTPDALLNVLSTLNQLKKGRLWLVFGCGGERDRSKRPQMAHAASQYAEEIIITSDNPRSEDPNVIIDEIFQGIPIGKTVYRIENREEAILYVLKHAAKEDIVLIAGKGHETYQEIGGLRYAFSDKEIIGRFYLEMLE